LPPGALCPLLVLGTDWLALGVAASLPELGAVLPAALFADPAPAADAPVPVDWLALGVAAPLPELGAAPPAALSVEPAGAADPPVPVDVLEEPCGGVELTTPPWCEHAPLPFLADVPSLQRTVEDSGTVVPSPPAALV
jgi:hypothetical protein